MTLRCPLQKHCLKQSLQKDQNGEVQLQPPTQKKSKNLDGVYEL